MSTRIARGPSRREFLRLGAGALIALGIAPGCARFRDAGHGDSGFSFVVINDAHFHTPQCPEFFARVREKLKSHERAPELCLFAGDLSEKGTAKELGAAREMFTSFGMPLHVVPGN